MAHSEPKITIDLKEYEELKQIIKAKQDRVGEKITEDEYCEVINLCLSFFRGEARDVVRAIEMETGLSVLIENQLGKNTCFLKRK